MKVLLVSATLFEVQPLLQRALPASSFAGRGVAGQLIATPTFDLLVSGVGQLQCAAQLARVLAHSSYDLVIQSGIAGSFTPTYPKRAVVRVVSEVCADLGAEDNGSFLDLYEMGLLSPDEPPFEAAELHPPELPLGALLMLPQVRSVTVNRVLSEPHTIEWVRRRYTPDVVNMEGAACFYAALIAAVPVVQVRAISDMVGPRDRSQWDIAGAITALDSVLEPLVADCVGMS